MHLCLRTWFIPYFVATKWAAADKLRVRPLLTPRSPTVLLPPPLSLFLYNIKKTIKDNKKELRKDHPFFTEKKIMHWSKADMPKGSEFVWRKIARALVRSHILRKKDKRCIRLLNKLNFFLTMYFLKKKSIILSIVKNLNSLNIVCDDRVCPTFVALDNLQTFICIRLTSFKIQKIFQF